MLYPVLSQSTSMNAPATKMAATKGYGATVVTYEPEQVAREDVAAEIQKESGATLIPPFNHPHVIAGQGTAALELFQEVNDLDLLLVPCGGGGLLSGSSVAAKNLNPKCQVIGIEPELGDDATRVFGPHLVRRAPRVPCRLCSPHARPDGRIRRQRRRARPAGHNRRSRRRCAGPDG